MHLAGQTSSNTSSPAPTEVWAKRERFSIVNLSCLRVAVCRPICPQEVNHDDGKIAFVRVLQEIRVDVVGRITPLSNSYSNTESRRSGQEPALLSIGLGVWPNLQAIRHPHQLCERLRTHLQHYPSPMNLDCSLTDSQFGTRLLVE